MRGGGRHLPSRLSIMIIDANFPMCILCFVFFTNNIYVWHERSIANVAIKVTFFTHDPSCTVLWHIDSRNYLLLGRDFGILASNAFATCLQTQFVDLCFCFSILHIFIWTFSFVWLIDLNLERIRCATRFTYSLVWCLVLFLCLEQVSHRWIHVFFVGQLA